MKPHFKSTCTLLATALATALQPAAHAAAVPLAWEARPGNPAPAQFTRYHGETLALRCTLAGFDGDLSAQGDVRLWFQTNGMGRLWWSAPATAASNRIEAAFGAAEDVGADRVSLFLGSPSNVYASAVLRLMPSPGFTPADLSLPVLRLDFSALAVTNAPYYTKAETDSKIIELSPPTSLAPAINYTDSAINDLSSVLRDTIAESTMYAVQSDGTDWQNVLSKTSSITPSGYLPYTWYFDGKAFASQELEMQSGDGNYEHHLTFDDASMRWTTWYAPTGEDGAYDESTGRRLTQNDIAYLSDIPSPPDLTPYATKTELGGVSETANAAALDAASALRIVLGESVWFAVTNYMRTAEGVIPSLQLWEVRDSVTNLVYDSREEITNTVKALTRELHTELTNSIHAVSNAMPSKAWGNYQSDGTDNPEPGKVAIINQPTVILTGGGTFNKYLEVGNSSVWVLKSSGLCSFGGDTNGNFFAVLDDEGKTHFKVSKTDSFDVDAICNGIFPRQSQSSVLLYVVSTNRQGQVYASPPVLSASTNLQETVWHEEVDGEVDPLGLSVSWERDDAISAWVATITPDTYPPALFLKAKVKQEGGVSVINTAPVRFDGGIQLGNGKYRLVPYTTGGKTYLTVEGLQ